MASTAISVVCPHAKANGNYSHVWISTDALDYLEEGALRSLLTTDNLRNILRNGAMFPDGGYAVGDGYGEISHWEPFHLTYLKWITANYAPPWSNEATEHIAFLMGMAAHGIADQLYDGMYLKRHEYYDEHGSEATLFGVDGATDACFAATQGPMELPVNWVPADILAPLFKTVSGHQVNAGTIKQGHGLVVIAIMAANDAINDPDKQGEYMEIYPWACSHQDDPTVPGSPPTISPAVARYWNTLWSYLHGDEAFDKPLLGTYFSGGTPYHYPRDAGTPESWVSFAMPRGLDPGTVNAESVVVTDANGQPHAVETHVYYGFNSHLVNIKPQEDWDENTGYTVTVSPPITTWDGVLLEQTHSFTFATTPEPPDRTSDIITVDVSASEIEIGDIGTADFSATDIGTADIKSSGSSNGGCSLVDRTTSHLPESLLLLSLIFGLAYLGYRPPGVRSPHSIIQG